MSNRPPPVRVTALGGSLKRGSSSPTALRAAAAGAGDAGAEVELLEVAALDLAPYAPGGEPPAAARRLAESAAQANAMLWSSPLYHGSVSGSFKNTIDRDTGTCDYADPEHRSPPTAASAGQR